MAISRKKTNWKYRPLKQFLITRFLGAKFPGLQPADIVGARAGEDSSTFEFVLATIRTDPHASVQLDTETVGVLSKEQIGNLIRLIDATVTDDEIVGAEIPLDDTTRVSFSVKPRAAPL